MATSVLIRKQTKKIPSRTNAQPEHLKHIYCNTPLVLLATYALCFSRFGVDKESQKTPVSPYPFPYGYSFTILFKTHVFIGEFFILEYLSMVM